MSEEIEINLPETIEPETEALPTQMDRLMTAMQSGMDPDQLDKFMALQERYEANEARKAYAVDMATCQEQMPGILAEDTNPQTGSAYAKLERITKQITPVYTANGFSVTFGELPIDLADWIRIEATVLHRLGHCEKYQYDLPLDKSGAKGNVNKTDIHAKGSSTTYARRYLTLMIFNLTVGDDVDGNLPDGESRFIDEDQALTLHALVDENGLNHEAILREFGVLNYEQVKPKDFEKVEARIRQLIDARNKR